MGGESTTSRAVVQSAGRAFRLSASVMKDEFNRAPVLHLLLRYTQGPDHANGPDGRVQPAPTRWTSSSALAAAEPGPAYTATSW